MTLNDIVVEALKELGYGDDAQAIEVYSPKFTPWVNEAVRKIADHYGKTRTQTMTLNSDDQFSVATFEREYIDISRVVDEDDNEIEFYQDPPSSGLFTCTTDDATVAVTYTYYPNILINASDTPDIPVFAQAIIPTYVIGKEKMSGDASTQSTASAYFQLFHSAVRSLPTAKRGDVTAHRFRNRWS